MAIHQFDVIVIGAGAAGLMCAIEAGKRGRRVLVLDHANKVGKKILLSGGGRCNFTNRYTTPENYLSQNPHFCISALSRYTSHDFETLVQKHKIRYHEKTLGQLFCDESARDIVAMLLIECDRAKVNIRSNCQISKIQKEVLFQLETTQGIFKSDALVVATGGLSFPTMGASPFGYKIAEQFGLKVLPVRAGLVPLTLHRQDLATLSGISLEVEARVGKQAFKENMLFTHRGLSGPAILQISSYWKPGEALHLNLLPDQDAVEFLREQRRLRPKAELKTLLAQVFPARFAELIAQEPDASKTLNDWEIMPNGTEGYRTAEVTLGGIDTHGVSSKTFAVKAVPGLYFIGEVLDVTGHLGGFNFQWAWSSGWCCGQVV